MLCDLLHAKLVWMPSGCYIPIYFLQNWVFLSVTFAEWHWQFNSMFSCLIRDLCLSLGKTCVAEWIVRETQNLYIADSNPTSFC